MQMQRVDSDSCALCVSCITYMLLMKAPDLPYMQKLLFKEYVVKVAQGSYATFIRKSCTC